MLVEPMLFDLPMTGRKETFPEGFEGARPLRSIGRLAGVPVLWTGRISMDDSQAVGRLPPSPDGPGSFAFE